MAAPIQTVGQLRDALRSDPDTALSTLSFEPLPDTLIYRIVVSSLGIVVVLAAAGAIYLGAQGKDAPTSLVALGSAAIGALAGLLAPSPAKQG